MKLEIDMSGCDIFQNGAVIGISNYKGVIKGFQMNEEIISGLKKNWKAGRYFCKYSKRGLGFFKVMVYSSIVCCLIDAMGKIHGVEMEICRDFRYHENNIKQRLFKLIRKKLGIKVHSIKVWSLPNNSDIDNYVYLMYKDNYNLLSTYVNLQLKDIEKFLL